MDYEKLNDIIVSMRRDLHQIPEVGTELPNTKNYVINKLKELGLSYKESSIDSGLVCDIGEGTLDNVVAIRADMDALPIAEETGCEYASKNGNMHACGHDAHTACLLGAAYYLIENKSRIKGRVRLVFQAAEELAVGAHNMLNSGLLDGVKAIVGTHIGTLSAGTSSGEFILKEGPLMASNDRIFIKVIGKGAHGAYPHLSVDPILTASQIIQGIYNIKSREILATDPVIISICMVHGGTQYNVIPTEVNIEGTFRTFSEKNRAFITERIKDVAQSIAAANRAEAEVVIKRRGAPVVNNEKIYEQLNEVCKELGFKKASHYSLTMAGEDFADYLEKIDGAFILFSTATEKNIPHHNSKFEIDESKLYQPPVLMSEWAIKYFESNK